MHKLFIPEKLKIRTHFRKLFIVLEFLLVIFSFELKLGHLFEEVFKKIN